MVQLGKSVSSVSNIAGAAAAAAAVILEGDNI